MGGKEVGMAPEKVGLEQEARGLIQWHQFVKSRRQVIGRNVRWGREVFTESGEGLN
jgi:hypothetical protein